MAGYVIAVGGKKGKKEEQVYNFFKKGVYGTLFSEPKSTSTIWNASNEGTFADYLGMKAGDYIFFFGDRKIFGVGRLKNLDIEGERSDCKFLNYPGSDIPMVQEPAKDVLLHCNVNAIKGKEIHPRVVCIFEPYPFFCEGGVDMDDVLQSNPDCFKMLRVFEKLSFIKVDDFEAKCFLDVVLKRLKKSRHNYKKDCETYHKKISDKLNKNYLFSGNNILQWAVDKKHNDMLAHEMAIEADLMHQLLNINMFPETEEIFGRWDYISHQVVASPLKPIMYMDKMDIFAYRYLTNIPDMKIKDAHCIIELKQGVAYKDDIEQTLKYVDWIKDEYTGQDYSVIEAFLVAYSIPEDVRNHQEKVAKRTYQIGTRPTTTREWSGLRLIEYSYNFQSCKLVFTDVTGK